MALHGEIRVNGTRIGSWMARRLDGLTPGREIYTYECSRVLMLPDGRFEEAEFEVEHRYVEGAAALASKVLTQAAQ